MIIGLTGGIGSGKTAVSRYLMSQGYAVSDADKIARQIVMPGAPALLQIADAFGEEVLLPDGTLDRKKVANMVFFDEKKRETLNAITHSKILEVIQTAISQVDKNDFLFIDAALLFETGLDEEVDYTVVVHAEDSLRIERIMERDGLTEAEVVSRIRRQMSAEEKLYRADFVLYNSGTLEELYQQTDELLKKLKAY